MVSFMTVFWLVFLGLLLCFIWFFHYFLDVDKRLEMFFMTLLMSIVVIILAIKSSGLYHFYDFIFIAITFYFRILFWITSLSSFSKGLLMLFLFIICKFIFCFEVNVAKMWEQILVLFSLVFLKTRLCSRQQ